MKDFLAAHGIKGRVRYYGCPAEEGGAAKGFMVRAGVFPTWMSRLLGTPPPSPASMNRYR